MAEEKERVGFVQYETVGVEYFENRTLRKYAGIWSLWALGVGAVISGHFSGWNLGLGVGGFGGFLIAGILIGTMYLCMCFCLAEMSPALPHTGAAYSFARTSMGPWGGYLTGVAENIEYVVTPAVITYFISAYLGGIFPATEAYPWIWWIVSYAVFLTLNLLGVELSFKVSVVVTVLALLVLAVFWISAIPQLDFTRYALNIGTDESGNAIELPEGGGPFLPFGAGGILAAMPFAVWLFLAIEQLPLAAEESHAPQKDMPKGLLTGIATLALSATLITFLNPSIAVQSADGTQHGAFYLGQSGEPLLDGFRAIYGTGAAVFLSLLAIIGLIASLHTIIFAMGRQVYSLSRAGYFPRALSVTHGTHKVPHVALILGSVVGFALMLAVFLIKGGEDSGAFIGGALLNMAVFGAMISYFMQGLSFVVLRRTMPHIPRPFVSPLGVAGGFVTMAIALVTLIMQLQDPVYRVGVYCAAAWYVICVVYFALIGRHKLVRSPEEDFAEKAKALGRPAE